MRIPALKAVTFLSLAMLAAVSLAATVLASTPRQVEGSVVNVPAYKYAIDKQKAKKAKEKAEKAQREAASRETQRWNYQRTQNKPADKYTAKPDRKQHYRYTWKQQVRPRQPATDGWSKYLPRNRKNQFRYSPTEQTDECRKIRQYNPPVRDAASIPSIPARIQSQTS